MTKIVYLGNPALDYATENHICADAIALGFDVARAQEPNRVYDRTWRRGFEMLCDGADVVLYSKTYGLPLDAVNLWRSLEANGTKTASVHLDLYVGLPRQNEVGIDPFWHTGMVFTADGDEASAAFFQARGIWHHWFPPACVSSECEPGDFREEYNHDVTFVGTQHYHPIWQRQRRALIAGLESRYGPALGLYGSADRIVRGKDLNDLYASVSVAAGDSLALPGHTHYWSDRLTETIGRGGALTFPRITGIEELGFTDGEHLRFYDPADLDGHLDIVDELLADPEGTRAMAKRGQEFVRRNHTYGHRVRMILDELAVT